MKQWIIGVFILVITTSILNLVNLYVVTDVITLSFFEWWGVVLTMVLILSGIMTYKDDNINSKNDG